MQHYNAVPIVEILTLRCSFCTNVSNTW